MKKRGLKKGLISEYLPWLLIGVAILVILMVGIFLLRGKGLELINQMKDIFRGR